MICPRCGKDNTLIGSTVPLLGGEVVQQVRCVICGFMATRPVSRHPMRRAVTPNKYTQTVVQCAVTGCENTCYPSEDGLCSPCRQRLRVWEKRKDKTIPPPIELVNGIWVGRTRKYMGAQRQNRTKESVNE